MRPAVDRYLDRLLAAADLAAADERAVREELSTHLALLVRGAEADGLDEQEIDAMIENEFGDPQSLGHEIGRSKGRLRTWAKKQARRAPLALAVAVVALLLIRSQVAQAFEIAGDSMEPALPRGAWVMVNKLASVAPDDLVVYLDETDRNIVAVVERVDESAVRVSKLNVPASGEWPRSIARERIVGRVVLVRR